MININTSPIFLHQARAPRTRLLLGLQLAHVCATAIVTAIGSLLSFHYPRLPLLALTAPSFHFITSGYHRTFAPNGALLVWHYTQQLLHLR